MKLKLNTAIFARPDARGHYNDELAKRLIAFGLAEELTEAAKGAKKGRAKK